MREFYLETSAIRELSHDLKRVKNLCFTSSLVLMELIGGLANNKDFNIRKSVVNNVLTSGILIDWRSAIDVIVSAFPKLGSNDDIIDDLRRLAEILVKSENFNTFRKNSDSLKFGLSHFAKLDNDLGAIYSQSMKNKLEELKKMKNSKVYKSTFIVTKDRAIASIAHMLCESLTKPLSLLEQESVFNSYNGKIDSFISLWTWHSNKKLKEWNPAAQNDWIDLHHTAYLAKNTKFVTHDKMLIEGFNSLWPGRVILVKEFREKYLKEP